MKQYIILSSLNVDNILSSESISPISFYGKRDFGYKLFQKIEGITIINDIILFSKLPFFEIKDSEKENYPMAIEIDDDDQLKKKIRTVIKTKTDCDIFLCNQTIYLNPWNCKILFFSQQAMTLAKLKCEDSLCNKLSNFFRLEVIAPNRSFLLFDALKEVYFEQSNFNPDQIDIDNKINKIKGFLYGYYLGITKYLSDDVAQLLGLQKRIYNIVASIINNKGENSDRFIEELRRLDLQYNETDPHKKEIRNLWSEKILSRFSSFNDKNTFEAILKELFIEGEAKTNFCKSNSILVRKLTFSLSNKNFDWVTYQSELSNYTQSIITEDKIKVPIIDLKKKVSVQGDYSGIHLNEIEAQLYNDILAKYFLNEVITVEDLRLNKLNIATEFTKGIKNIMESEKKNWDNSSEKKYFNSLRLNIANSEPFILQEAPNIIYLSIAAFLLKGDDFNALSRYLEENCVSNYNYVLGFWGAACGYVDMSKPIFTPILKDKETFCNTYKSIHYLLFNNELEGALPDIIYKHNNIYRESFPKYENRNNSNNENKRIYSDVISNVKNKLTNKEKGKQYEAIINSAYEIAKTPENFLFLLNKKGIRITTNVYKEFKSLLSPFINNQESVNPIHFPENSNQSNLSFLTDTNHGDHIYSLIFDEKNLKQFKTDLMWFIENHKEYYLDDQKVKQPGFYYRRSSDNKSLSDNKTLLDQFELYLKNKRKNNFKWLSDIYKEIPIEKIIEKLRTIYK